MKLLEVNKAPKAKKIDHILSLHGVDRNDPYFWMNQRDDKDVIEYLEAENKYAEEILEPTKGLQDELYEEIVGRIKKDDESVPFYQNGYFYYVRFEKGKEYPIYCRKKQLLENPEEVVIDVNEVAKDHKYYDMANLSISPDNNILAYAEDTLSRRIYTIRFLDLTTREMLPDVIERASDSLVWAKDNKTLFYGKKDKTLRPHKIFRHTLGSTAKDKLVYHEKDNTYAVDVSKTKSRDFIIISSGSTLSTENWILESDNPEGEFRLFQEREDELEYGIEHYKDQFYILTNWEAKNFRIMSCPLTGTSKEFWKEEIPHREEVMVEDFDIFENFLAIEERQDGLAHIRIIDYRTAEDYYIDFGEETYSAGIGFNAEFNTDFIRFEYSSLTTPRSVYDYDVRNKMKLLRKEQEVLGDFDKNNYETKRLWIKARDGVSVPVSILYKKGIEKTGENPLLLYAYGSYGYSTDASFSSVRLSLVDRGFVYAIAHIRGGEELGRDWYDNGKMLQKKNTFTDFIDCAKALIERKYTNKDLLFAMGGSAGGLLTGAVLNEAPELFKGVISAVPFVDVVTTMLDESIPLTTGEYDEWGNPNEKEYFDYMLTYSPYDNVKAQDYPNMLVTTGYHDSQVQYWEPAKWVAKLRELKTDDNILLFYTNMDAGHSGASGRFKIHKETAMEYAFLLSLV